MAFDFDELVEKLKKAGALEKITDRRVGTNKLPPQLFMLLILASEATGKSMTSCVETALWTYIGRNQEKHLNGLKLMAAQRNMSVEDYICWVIKTYGRS